MDKKIIYQVLPRLFGNTNSTNKQNGTIEENGVGKLSAFTDKALKEIKKMGFTHIWYTGVLEHASKTSYKEHGIKANHPDVVKGNAGSPYAIRDYYDVSPDLADDVNNRIAEFEALIERSHKNGLKVIMDFVPNHVAREYKSDARPQDIKDFGEGDDLNVDFKPDNNFYYMIGQSLNLSFGQSGKKAYTEFPARVTGNDCFSATPSQNDWYETVKLNYGFNHNDGSYHIVPVPDTWEKMRDILIYWTEKGVDGFRCDMAEMVLVEFWNWVIPHVKRKNHDIIFIAEIYNPAVYHSYINWGMFDYLYDKVGLYDTLRGVACGYQPASDITACWQNVEGIQNKMLNFMENHDEQRIASDFFAGEAKKGIPAMIVSATISTSPVMVYFGQELGEKGMDNEGFSGLDGRTTIFDYWSVESIRNWYNEGKFGVSKLAKEQKELRAFYVKLLNLCNTEKAISEGEFFDLMYANNSNPNFDSNKQYAYLRFVGKECLLIVANFSDQTTDVSVHIPMDVYERIGIEPKKMKKASELLSSKDIELPADLNNVKLNLESHSGQIIKLS